jgi:hypothetical protein
MSSKDADALPASQRQEPEPMAMSVAALAHDWRHCGAVKGDARKDGVKGGAEDVEIQPMYW